MLRKVQGGKRRNGKKDEAADASFVVTPLARMEDVARIANVSMMTVSRALRTPTAVAPDTLARVQAALKTTGYLPNLVASGLASSRTRVVASLIPLINSAFAPTLQSMSDVLRSASYQLVLGVTRYDAAREEELLRTFFSRRVDGIALFAGGHTRKTIAMLRASRIPLVEMWADASTKPIVDSVGVSQRNGAREAVRHLVSRGRKRIGFIGGSTRHNIRAQARLRGYLDGLEEAGLPRDTGACEEATWFHMEEGAAALSRLLDRRPKLDAVCMSSDVLAAGAVVQAQRRGLAVPADLAITGFDNSEFSGSIYPALTTINMKAEQIGLRSAEMLLERMHHGNKVDLVATPPRKVDLGWELIVREST